jgi:2-iminobutanoate/2-iminopropanoate deaminase
MQASTIFQLSLSFFATALLTSMPLSAAEDGHKYFTDAPTPDVAQLPFSEAVQAGETLYVSGTIGLDTKTSQAASDTKTEAKLVMDSVKKAIEQAGYAMDDVVSVQVFCTNLDLYGTFNDIYRTYFHGHYPARAFIGVNQLVRGAHFEVTAIAVKSGAKAAAKH